MTKDAGDELHKYLKGLTLTVAENIPLPDKSWSCYLTDERPCDHYGTTYYPDVYIQWAKRGIKGGNYKVYIEIQKDMNSKTFWEKIEVYKHLVKERNIHSFIIIDENKCPENIMEVGDWIRNQIEMNCLPW